VLSELLHLGCLPIGVDIGAGGVKLLQLRASGGELRLEALARIDLPMLPDQAPEDDSRIDAVVQAIALRLDAGGFGGRKCVISLDDRMVRTRSVRQPRMSLATTRPAPEVAFVRRSIRMKSQSVFWRKCSTT
jgi:Tfp pilus assembly PilM family ATPase